MKRSLDVGKRYVVTDVKRVPWTATSVSLAYTHRWDYSRSEVRLHSQRRRRRSNREPWDRRQRGDAGRHLRLPRRKRILILCFQVLLSRSSTLSILQTQLRSTSVSHFVAGCPFKQKKKKKKKSIKRKRFWEKKRNIYKSRRHDIRHVVELIPAVVLYRSVLIRRSSPEESCKIVVIVYHYKSFFF